MTNYKQQLPCIIALATLLLMPHYPAAAEVYRWVDDNGRIHFSDEKPAQQKADNLDLGDINAIPTVEVTAKPVQKKASDTRKPVIMYSTEWCGFCRQARQYFQQKGIPFKKYDVEKSRKGKADHKKLGGGGVPIILIGKKQMQGFSVARFEQLYFN